MFRMGNWASAGFAVCMLAAQAANAGVGFQPVSSDELNLKAESLAPGAPAIILYRQVDRDDNSSTSHEDEYFRIKVLTEEGRKYGNVEIPFLKKSQNVVNLHARTIRPDGTIVEFAGQSFDKELVKGKGLKYLAKTLTLPEVQVGSIVEYYYTMDLGEHTLFESHWILNDELFTKKARFSLKPYHGASYVPFSLHWVWANLPAGATPTEGPDHIFRMEANNIPAFQYEDYMPPPNELRARVDFIYEFGPFDKDAETYWQRVGKEWNGYLEAYVDKRKAMEQAVAQTVSPANSEDVKLRKIYDRVQQIRNTSYEVEKSQQQLKRDKQKWPQNVEDVWKFGYGNSIQLTWLFLGLARAAGFETYGCWVSDRRDYFFSQASRQSAKLNTNVVLVKLHGKDLFLDPGAAFTPFGLLTWSETGVGGMRLDKDGGTWIHTPLPQPSESRIERTGKLTLSDTGDLTGKLTVTFTGLQAMYYRVEERNADEVARKKSLEDAVTEQIPATAEVELTNKPDWTNSETPLVAEFNLKIAGWASNAGKRVMIPAAVFTAAEKGLFEKPNRVHPIYFSYPYEKVDDIAINLPAGWQVGGLPQGQDQNGRVIVYSLNVQQTPRNLRLTRKLSVNVVLLEQKYYSALRDFFQMVRNADGEQIVLQPGEIHASN